MAQSLNAEARELAFGGAGAGPSPLHVGVVIYDSNGVDTRQEAYIPLRIDLLSSAYPKVFVKIHYRAQKKRPQKKPRSHDSQAT